MFGILALLLVVSPPHFRHAPGWHVGSRPAHACAGVSASRCVQASGWASTVRYRDCPNCSPPHRTLAHLPPGGIVIQLSNGRERPSRAPTGEWPPRIRARDLTVGFEGEPDRYGVFQTIRADRNARAVPLRLVRPRPSDRHQLARANAELRTVSLVEPRAAAASSRSAASSARGGARGRRRSASSGRACAGRGAPRAARPRAARPRARGCATGSARPAPRRAGPARRARSRAASVRRVSAFERLDVEDGDDPRLGLLRVLAAGPARAGHLQLDLGQREHDASA